MRQFSSSEPGMYAYKTNFNLPWRRLTIWTWTFHWRSGTHAIHTFVYPHVPRTTQPLQIWSLHQRFSHYWWSVYLHPCCAFHPQRAQNPSRGSCSRHLYSLNGKWDSNTCILHRQGSTHHSSKWRSFNYVGFCPHSAPSGCAEQRANTTGSSFHS